jgi:hypothetical protein
MNVVSFIPLLLLFSNVTAAVPVTMVHHLNPSDLCPLIDIVDHELCNEHMSIHGHNVSSPVQELCSLLQKYNASFCSSHDEHHHDKMMSNDAMSVRVLYNEYYDENQTNEAHKAHEAHDIHDVHKICPIINFIEEELCSSDVAVEVKFDPKELCPLLNLTYTEICSSSH